MPENQQQQKQQAAKQERTPEPEPAERPRTGNAAKPKRRNAQRRSVVPDLNAPTEVVRDTTPHVAPVQPMRMRKIDPNDNSEPSFGCPMLTRTRLNIPFRGNQRVARCSAGWSIHDEDEVLLCQHTETVAQCWKDDPKHLADLLERIGPMIVAELEASEKGE